MLVNSELSADRCTARPTATNIIAKKKGKKLIECAVLRT
jgi:hypothetical protein